MDPECADGHPRHEQEWAELDWERAEADHRALVWYTKWSPLLVGLSCAVLVLFFVDALLR